METNRQTDWSVWGHIPDAKLWELVALSLDIDPRYARENPEVFEEPEFQRRLLIAERNLLAGRLTPIVVASKTRNSVASMPQFAAWAKSLEWQPLPKQMGKRAARATKEPVRPRWPWGDRTTKLLDELAAAHDAHWKTYDPTKPTSAPKNDVVVAWLRKRGVAERTSQEMARMLRADELHPGPRPGPPK